MRARSRVKQWEVFTDDADAKYYSEHEWDLSTMEPMVAKPHSPDNKDTARNCRDVKLDRAYIGSCTGGKTSDFLEFARVLQGKRVAIDTFGVPATPEIVNIVSPAATRSWRFARLSQLPWRRPAFVFARMP